VIHVPAVAEFVNNNAVQNFRRHQYQKAVEIEIPVNRAASPARLLQADKDALVTIETSKSVDENLIKAAVTDAGYEYAGVIA